MIKPVRVSASGSTVFAVLTSLLAVLALTALLAAPASAQAPAICEQYQNLPQCEGDGGPTGGADDSVPLGGDGIGGPSVVAGDQGPGGELPFTGYPLTWLILLLLALLVTGLAIRAYLAIRDSRSATPAGAFGTEHFG